MRTIKCPVCHSNHTVKTVIVRGLSCINVPNAAISSVKSQKLDDDQLWQLYQGYKQTIQELSERLGVSASTIRRHLGNVTFKWEQPSPCGSGFVHLDATYWGHNWGILIGLDEQTSKVLYLSFIHNETTADYVAAAGSIEARGYEIKGLIIDGKQALFKEFSRYKIQMCQFHMKQ